MFYHFKHQKNFPFKHFKTPIHNTIIPFYMQPSICIIPLTLSRESWVPPPTMFQNPQTPEGSFFPIKNEWRILWNYLFCQYDRTYCSCFYWKYLFKNMVHFLYISVYFCPFLSFIAIFWNDILCSLAIISYNIYPGENTGSLWDW